MLKSSDLSRFVYMLKEVEAEESSVAADLSIQECLGCETGGLTRADFFCLCQSLQIAAVAGDIESSVADVADYIRRKAMLDRYIELSSTDNWTAAIRLALKSIKTDSVSGYSSASMGREGNVGNACRFLRNRGYPVKIDAFGCQIDEDTTRRITCRIDTLVRIVGGEQCFIELFRILQEQERYHDGFWLFGDRVPSAVGCKTPTLPYAWLARLALQNLSKKSSARKPDVAWKNLTDLATHFAACCNFERYNQFEGIDLQSGDLGLLFARSAGWQQLFMLKQVPKDALYLITRALNEKLSAADRGCLKVDIVGLSAELKSLVAYCPEKSISLMLQSDAMRAWPILWSESMQVSAQKRFSNPFDPNALSHEDRLLFECDGNKVLMLPRALAAAAACNFLFGLIWKRLENKRARVVVGAVFERVIELACASKATSVFPDIKYTVGKTGYQIDLAVMSNEHVSFFEVKAKSLTKPARSGDTIAFLTDYADSYLSLLKQLVRDERHFRAGVDMSPLTVNSPKNFRVTKVAVSPLSYGPVGDRMLANGIVGSLSQTKLLPVNPNPDNEKKLTELSDIAREILFHINEFTEQKDNSIDLHSYMIDVFWLDIGELIYMLGRANSVTDALAPLRHITFSSRDIWTEIANAERMKITEKYWNPLPSYGTA